MIHLLTAGSTGTLPSYKGTVCDIEVIQNALITGQRGPLTGQRACITGQNVGRFWDTTVQGKQRISAKVGSFSRILCSNLGSEPYLNLSQLGSDPIRSQVTKVQIGSDPIPGYQGTNRIGSGVQIQDPILRVPRCTIFCYIPSSQQ